MTFAEFEEKAKAYAEREFSAWVDADADFEEPLDEETEGG